MVGTWQVTYGQYRYHYAMAASGAVRWRDYWDSSETGTGTWSKTGDSVDFVWKGSTTKERWTVNESCINTRAGSVIASYGTFKDLAAIKQDTVDETQDLMAQWAAAIAKGEPFSSPHICHFAKPYLWVKGAPRYDPTKMGGPIQQIRGLAIHTTWGWDGRTLLETVNGTVKQWNDAQGKVGAHFAIAGDGTLLQIVPTNRIAYAQGGPSDQYYLSVEIENRETPMKRIQLDMAQRLFTWVVKTFGVPPKLATGYVGAASKNPNYKYAGDAKRQYDLITPKVCAEAGVETTTDPQVAAAASGLSCHYWLHPTKPCPGKGMLSQMAEIVSGSNTSPRILVQQRN
jgi:hypothetical protein